MESLILVPFEIGTLNYNVEVSYCFKISHNRFYDLIKISEVEIVSK